MRVALLALALLALVSSQAPAQERSRYTTPKPQPPAAAGLRGPVSPAAPAAPTAPAAPQVEAETELADPIGGAASIRWLSPSDRGPGNRCRSSCDKTYYRCLSADDGDCPTSWGQCRSRCERRRS